MWTYLGHRNHTIIFNLSSADFSVFFSNCPHEYTKFRSIVALTIGIKLQLKEVIGDAVGGRAGCSPGS